MRPIRPSISLGAEAVPPRLELTAEERDSELRLVLSGFLNAAAAQEWNRLAALSSSRVSARRLVFDLGGLTSMDFNGMAQLLSLRAGLEKDGRAVFVENLPERFAPIAQLAAEALARPLAETPLRPVWLEELGRSAAELARDLKSLTLFLGELTVEFLRLARHPGDFNWPGAAAAAETSGVNATPIVALVSFLVGLIIAFQAAMITKIFGAEIYVATLVGVSVVRELGPLIAAIVLAGRSGSAFSAELGTMRVSEEIDALTTMGLSPVRELVLPRVLAQVAAAPAVTLIAGFVGIFGGSLVLMGMGYTMAAYWRMAVEKVTLASFLIGFFKSFVFGFVVGAIGCQRGLAAGDGPGAVGEATTSGVVTNIVVIAILDSLFAVVFYVVDI